MPLVDSPQLIRELTRGTVPITIAVLAPVLLLILVLLEAVRRPPPTTAK